MLEIVLEWVVAGVLIAMGITVVACVICMIRSMFWD